MFRIGFRSFRFRLSSGSFPFWFRIPFIFFVFLFCLVSGPCPYRSAPSPFRSVSVPLRPVLVPFHFVSISLFLTQFHFVFCSDFCRCLLSFQTPFLIFFPWSFSSVFRLDPSSLFFCFLFRSFVWFCFYSVSVQFPRVSIPSPFWFHSAAVSDPFYFVSVPFLFLSGSSPFRSVPYPFCFVSISLPFPFLFIFISFSDFGACSFDLFFWGDSVSISFGFWILFNFSPFRFLFVRFFPS